MSNADLFQPKQLVCQMPLTGIKYRVIATL